MHQQNFICQFVTYFHTLFLIFFISFIHIHIVNDLISEYQQYQVCVLTLIFQWTGFHFYSHFVCFLCHCLFMKSNRKRPQTKMLNLKMKMNKNKCITKMVAEKLNLCKLNPEYKNNTHTDRQRETNKSFFNIISIICAANQSILYQ